MADEEPDRAEDPWLTLAEIAEELRMSPATIRSWISNGTLRAMRPGKRKLLVRRSELDRMLRGEDMLGPESDQEPEGGWRAMDTVAPPGQSPHWPAQAVEHVSRGGWLGVAETEWRTALHSSAMAPPDAGFVVRIREIAEAAARKAAAFANMDEAPGAWWQRQSGLPDGILSYELRPAGNRPGPSAAWARFDAAVEELGAAMESRSVPAEQAALERLSLVMHEIADALERRGVYPWPGSAEYEQVDDDSAAEEPRGADDGTD